MKKFKLLSICLTVFVFYAKTQNFIKETICSMGSLTSIGVYCNVAISLNQKIHICHYDYLHKDLLYTTNTTGTWQTTIIDSAGQIGEYCSIAVDLNNYAHISYFKFIRNDSIGTNAIPYGNLGYATNESGHWLTSTLDTASGLFTRVCVDKQNFVHIVHTQLGIGSFFDLLNIKYTTNKSGTWQSAAIQPGIVKGSDGSIAADNNMNIHIAIRNEQGTGTLPSGGIGGLRYITNETGYWTWVDVDTNYYSGNDVDISLDSNNSAHISYLDKTRGLKYATNQTGSWSFSILDSIANVGWNTSIATDNNNKVHISYSDPSTLLQPPGNGYLKFISNSSGTWNIKIVDSANAGLWTCIALDAEFLPHIVYTSIYNGSAILNHAYQTVITGLSGYKNTEDNICISPNPATNLLKIKIKDFKVNTKVIICDIRGIILKYIYLANENIILNISDLSQGMYFVSVCSANIMSKPIKFIKQ